MDVEKVPDYGRLSELNVVPVLKDWSGLTPEEFARTYADQPVNFQGLAARWPAFRKWTPEFLVEAIGAGTRVEVRQPIALGGTKQQWSARVPMGVFAAEVQSVPGLYLAEWYPNSHRPELLADIGPVPDFLDEDWLAAIPDPAFSTQGRMPIYWGAAGSATDCHFDNSNTVTWNACFRGTKRWLLFSGREFPERTWQRKAAAMRLVQSGIATASNHTDKSSGFVTVDGIDRYFAGKLHGLPDGLKFYWADVQAGDVIYVPWRFFHQVHNVTESIALSRYYVARENYQAYLDFLRDVSRTAALTASLLASERVRRAVGSGSVRRLCSGGLGRAVTAAALRLTRLKP
jgi:oxalate decarboxylase/phosphoglucose isomerase-like protein (cupin superfamily)